MYVEWRWEWAFEILPQMLWATLNTFLAAGVGYAIAAIVGMRAASDAECRKENPMHVKSCTQRKRP